METQEHSGSPGATLAALAKQKRLDRSCVLCHQRKIRCDKKSPCRNCTRADVLCCYPSPEQAVRRPQKTTIADVSARLARLERTIHALSSDSPIKHDAESPEPSPHDFNVAAHDIPAPGSPGGQEKLVQGDSSSHYYNDALLARVMEEEQEIQSLIGRHTSTDPKNASSIQIEPPLSNFHLPLPGNKAQQPSQRCAIQLWQAFVNNVDPLVKILHIPTTQTRIYAAINHPNEAEPDVLTLLFSVLFAGTASLNPDQVMSLLDTSKNVALDTFKRGIEQSLAASNFLDSPTITSIQAMTLYIFCLRAYNGSRAVWTLNGLVIRSAQSIGLHRDGTNFNLSPFECEIRRRLWWYIGNNDSRIFEDHGFTIHSFDGTIDVALPLNVNDNELQPDMTHLPVVQPKWSEMAFGLMVIQSNNTLRRLYERALRPNTKPPTEQRRREAFDNLKAEFEITYLQHCDQNIPIQRAVYFIGQLLPRKLDFVSRQHWLKHYSAPTASSMPGSNDGRHGTEEDLIHACEILQIAEHFRTDDMLQGFEWSLRSYPQCHILMFVYRYLCVKPTGLLADKAWTLAETSFGRELQEQTGWRWTVLRTLRQKAMLARDGASPPSKDGGIDGTMHPSDISAGDSLNGVANGVISNGQASSMHWTSDAFDESLDWGAIMEGIDSSNYDF